MGPVDFTTPGIYLTFKDGARLILDHDQVEDYARCFLNDPAKVPEFVKQAADFQPCDICPQRDSGEFCHALRPVLPFFDILDRYASHDSVHLAYYAPDKEKHYYDDKPVDADCGCLLCTNYSRAYLRHLFKIKDLTAVRLATIHNLRFYSKLMEKLQKEGFSAKP